MRSLLLSMLLFLMLLIADLSALPDDLDRATVTAIAQGGDGFLWIGTQNGIYRFDGHEFVHSSTLGDRNDERPGLAGAHITAAFTSSDGRLFVGTQRRGLYLYNELTRSFGIVDLGLDGSQKPIHITALHERSSETTPAPVWVGTAEHGLVLLSGDSTIDHHYLHAPFDTTTLPSDHVTSIIQSRDGELWVGTADRGIAILNSEREEFELLQARYGISGSFPSNQISALALDDRQQIWVGTADSGVSVASAGERTMTFSRPADWPGELDDSHITDIQLAHGGQIWVATDGDGVVAFPRDPGRAVRHNATTGLGSGSAISLFEDRSGLLWVGLFGAGIRMFNPGPQGFHTLPCAMIDSEFATIIWALAEDTQGTIWIGTDASGVWRWNRGDAQCEPVRLPLPGYQSPDPLRVHAVEADRRGRVWIGFADHGVVALDGNGAVVARYASGANGNGFATNRILSLKAARDGSLWVGTNGSGLVVVDPSGDARPLTPVGPGAASPSGLVVYEIAETADGHIWAGTSAGNLYEYDPESQRFSIHDLGSLGPPLLVWSIVPDSDGSLWLGTRNSGVIRFAPSTGEIEYVGNLAGRHVYSATPDSHGTVWVSTDDGLHSVDIRSGTTQQFLGREGLPTHQFSYNASLAASDGSLYFGGVGGIIGFRPGALESDASDRPLVYSSITDPISGERLPVERQNPSRPGEPARQIVLPSAVRQFSLTVTAIDFAAPDRVEYRAQLLGRDREWVEVGSRRTLNYANLKAGEYVLRVGNTERDGEWSEQGLSFTVVVEPRLWERRSAQTGAALILAVAFGLIAVSVISSQDRRRTRAAEAGGVWAERLRAETTAAVHRHSARHQVRYGSHTIVDTAPCINGLVMELTASRDAGNEASRVAVQTAIEKIHLAPPVAVACGLIVAEIIAHRLEKATDEESTRRLLVGLVRDSGTIVLTVADSATEPIDPADSQEPSGRTELLVSGIGGAVTARRGEGSWFGRGNDYQITFAATT